MADRGPPAHLPPPVIPPAVCPVPPVPPPAPPAQHAVPPTQPDVPPVQPGPMPQLNWSHFKPEFAGKPEEDLEEHLLRTNVGWTPMHFQKVSRSSDFVYLLWEKLGYGMSHLGLLLKIGMVYKISLDNKIQR